MATRIQNERQYETWEELPDGGRRYTRIVLGRPGWKARYIKEVDAAELTLRF
jgi:hypothetical protein